MAISNLKALAYNILKEFKEPIVDDMDIPELEKCSECDKKIILPPRIKSFTALQCGHTFHRLCLDRRILLAYPNVCPYPNCNEKLEILDFSRRDSQSSGVSSIASNLGKNLQIDPLESVDEIMNEDSNEEDDTTTNLPSKRVGEPATNSSSNKKAKKPVKKKEDSPMLKKLIEELLTTVPEIPEEATEVDENTNVFLYYYSRISHAESKHEITNREVIECYYNLGAVIKKRFDHYRNLKHGERACLALVNDEIRKQLPNDIANDALKKRKERAGKIYDLFVSIGKERIGSIKTFSASVISNLSQDNIDYVIIEILARKAVA